MIDHCVCRLKRECGSAETELRQLCEENQADMRSLAVQNHELKEQQQKLIESHRLELENAEMKLAKVSDAPCILSHCPTPDLIVYTPCMCSHAGQ